MVWLVFSLWQPHAGAAPSHNVITNESGLIRLRRFALIISVLLFFMILSGGLVSGIRAGFGYNTWPLMNGYFFPPGLYGLDPAWTSIFQQNVTVQFNHRLFAYLLFVLILAFAFCAYRVGLFTQPLRQQFTVPVALLVAMLFVQVGLGISTLLFVVPVPLAAAHQGGAILLFTASLFMSHRLLSAKTQNI
jgi:cytochrome c oxidase assembly protein subunit 15